MQKFSHASGVHCRAVIRNADLRANSKEMFYPYRGQHRQHYFARLRHFSGDIEILDAAVGRRHICV